MAKKGKQEVAARPVKPMVYIGPEGMLYDGEDRPVAVLEPGLKNAELILRIVESVNALSGYSLDEIRRGAFHGGTNVMGGDGFNVVTGNGVNVQG